MLRSHTRSLHTHVKYRLNPKVLVGVLVTHSKYRANLVPCNVALNTKIDHESVCEVTVILLLALTHALSSSLLYLQGGH